MWLSVDPLVEDTMDAYGYCYQNPINLIDPTGMSPEGGGDGNPGKKNWFERAWDKIFGKEENKPIVQKVNVVIIFGGDNSTSNEKDYNDKNNEAIKKMDNSVVKITNIKNIDELKAELKSKLGNKKIKNLIILTHGSYNYLQLGEDGVSSTLKDSKGGDSHIKNLQKFKDAIKPYLDNSSVAFSGCYSGYSKELPESFKLISKKTNSTFYFDHTTGTVNPNRLNNSEDEKRPVFPNNKRNQRWNIIEQGKNSDVIHSLYFTRKGNINRSPIKSWAK
jgi:hypothetical protein